MPMALQTRPSEPIPVTVIKPPRRWMPVDFAELWRYRELFGFLVWRDIKVIYKQALLGIAWALLGPLLSTLIFTLIFGKLAKLDTDGLPQPVFYMIGLVIWRYFQQAVTFSSNCLVTNQALLTKIYMPRLILPASSIIGQLVDFSIGFTMLVILMLIYGIVPSATALMVVPLTLYAMLTAMGIGLLFSALNVKYRDIRQIVPFMLQLWMYCSVIVPFSQFELWTRNNGYEAWKYVFGINPMAGVVEGFRWALAGHAAPAGATVAAPWGLLLAGLPFTLGLLLLGVYYFKRVEGQFADVI